jgi:hypothetical protein
VKRTSSFLENFLQFKQDLDKAKYFKGSRREAACLRTAANYVKI